MTNLPIPVGYRILVQMRPAFVEGKTKSGLLFTPAESTERHDLASIMAKVVSIGDVCYTDQSRFGELPIKPWCKVGDWVLIRSYSGTRLKIDGTEYRLINDDTIDAVIPDPDAIERA